MERLQYGGNIPRAALRLAPDRRWQHLYVGTSIPHTYHQSTTKTSLYVVYSLVTEQESGRQEKLHIMGFIPISAQIKQPLGLLSSPWHGLFHITEEGKICPAATYVGFFGQCIWLLFIAFYLRKFKVTLIQARKLSKSLKNSQIFDNPKYFH